VPSADPTPPPLLLIKISGLVSHILGGPLGLSLTPQVFGHPLLSKFGPTPLSRQNAPESDSMGHLCTCTLELSPCNKQWRYTTLGFLSRQEAQLCMRRHIPGGGGRRGALLEPGHGFRGRGCSSGQHKFPCRHPQRPAAQAASPCVCGAPLPSRTVI